MDEFRILAVALVDEAPEGRSVVAEAARQIVNIGYHIDGGRFGENRGRGEKEEREEQ
jgi:hypothetical protein